MSTQDYVRLWAAIDRATDITKSSLMRTRHKAHLLKVISKLSPRNTDLVSRQVDRINKAEMPLLKHYERMPIVTALLREVEHDC